MRNRRVAGVWFRFFRILGNPRLQALHRSGIVQLIGSGMRLGGGLVALLGLLTRRTQ